MTQVGQNFGGAGLANITPQQMQDAGRLMMAAGIMAEFANNLGAGPFAFPSMPDAFNVRCGIVAGGCFQPGRGGCIMPRPAAEWTAKVDGEHTAKINLGDGQRLEIDERSSQITIVNDKTGERTRIWGDPHVEIDGKQAYDFWGTTTFTLENGTKITINTEQWGGNPNAYVASQVVITKGDNAIVVDGVSQNKLGDMSVTMSNNGREIDNAHRDGMTLHENATGAGWRTEGGNIATQTDMNATAVGREYGPNSNMPSMAELGENLGAFLFLGMLASFLGVDLGKVLANQGGAAQPEARPQEREVARPQQQPQVREQTQFEKIMGIDPNDRRTPFEKITGIKPQEPKTEVAAEQEKPAYVRRDFFGNVIPDFKKDIFGNIVDNRPKDFFGNLIDPRPKDFFGRVIDTSVSAYATNNRNNIA